jgi:hypothetical protein
VWNQSCIGQFLTWVVYQHVDLEHQRQRWPNFRARGSLHGSSHICSKTQATSLVVCPPSPQTSRSPHCLPCLLFCKVFYNILFPSIVYLPNQMNTCKEQRLNDIFCQIYFLPSAAWYKVYWRCTYEYKMYSIATDKRDLVSLILTGARMLLNDHWI